MGLQSLDRAMAVLRATGEAGAAGLRFTDLQRTLGWSKPTTHRLLAALREHGLLELEAGTRLYRLGPGLQALAKRATPSAPDLQRLCALAVERLAEATGDTVFLTGREGLQTICLARATGGYPIRAITVEVGSRRPLGIGAGGLAILAAMPEDDARRTVEVLRPRYRDFPLNTPEQILAAQRQARRQGYALSDERVARGVRGIGLALLDAQGTPVGAIGIAAIRARITAARIPELLALLTRERDAVATHLLRWV